MRRWRNEITKPDIAKAFGMYYDGTAFSGDELMHCFRFEIVGKKIRVDMSHSYESAWEEASNEFLKPLEKILFDNL